MGLLLLLLTACQSPNARFYNVFTPALTNAPALQVVTLTNQIDPQWLQPPDRLFTLGPGDRLDIDLIGETNTLTQTVVGPDGKLYFSLLPGIDVWGLTLGEAKARMESELAKYVRDRPQVSLALRGVESKRFWLLGRVQVPGVYPLQTPMTLLEAIANAGGTMSLSSYQDQSAAGINEDLADLKRSFVLRQGKMLPVDFERLLKEGDLSQNIYLHPDDFVYLPAATAREVYVLGAVQQAQRLPYREGMTVAAAIAGAYGTVRGAYLNNVAVVRGRTSNPVLPSWTTRVSPEEKPRIFFWSLTTSSTCPCRRFGICSATLS